MALSKQKGQLSVAGIDGAQIIKLLANRHSKDVFVSECKNGPSWGSNLLKLDAWSLLRTYSPLTTVGYEVKVSRQDFERDQKWTGYLDVCHQFYFVCPAGLIRAIDLPPGIGLIWVSTTGHLHTKHHAERKVPDVEKLNRLLIYVLMARCNIVDSMYDRDQPAPKDRLTVLREAVDDAEKRKELAYFIKGHVQKAVIEAQGLNMQLSIREDNIKRFVEHLQLLGITWNSESSNWYDTQEVDNAISLLKQRIDESTLWKMKALAKQLTETADLLNKYHELKKEGLSA